MLERDTVAIIGGLGRMGQVTRDIFENAGYPTLVSDIKDPTTLPAREAIRNSRIVFFSVLPIEGITDIINSCSDVFNRGDVVMDNASVKNPLKTSYEALDQRGVSICSTHPLFKEDQPALGQNVLILPFGGQPQEATSIAEDVSGKAGMVLIRMDFDQHDKTSLFTQLVPHAINRTLGHLLATQNVDPQVLEAMATANSRLSSLAQWRTLVQPSEVSAMLISNLGALPEGQEVLEALRRSTDEITGTSKADLERIFNDDVVKLDPTGQFRSNMNYTTTTILERLANLGLHSTTLEIDTTGDQPGLLAKMAGVLSKYGVNLNAVDSSHQGKVLKFALGIESGEITPEVISELEGLGFQVSKATK
jgi:prephenate dehydrogenase